MAKPEPQIAPTRTGLSGSRLACAHLPAFCFLLTAFSLLVLGASPAAAGGKSKDVGPRKLRHRIEEILTQGDAARGFWGVKVVRLRDGKTLYASNADQLFLPASGMKLFTTAAGLEKLGPDFHFRTTVESDSPPGSAGRAADLVLVGHGDANFATTRVLPYDPKAPKRGLAEMMAVFDDLARQVAANGIREVTGDLIADDRYFVEEPYDPAWSIEDLAWGYGAPVTAIAINDNQLIPHIRATEFGRVAAVTLTPLPDYYTLKNGLVTWYEQSPKVFFVDRQPGSQTLQVWGRVPPGTNEDEDPISIANPPELAVQLFAQALDRQGIKVQGKTLVLEESRANDYHRRGSDPPSPPPLFYPRPVKLAEHISPRLAEGVKVILKVSENLHAEMLLRALGREIKHDGSVRGGLEVLQEFATLAGISPEEAQFRDGSGLSRLTLVEPEAIVKLLEFMSRSKTFGIYLDALPVAGVDGTLAHRFVGSPIQGRVRAKTGGLAHVHTLSGYMDTPSGERLAFSIMTDNQPLTGGRAIAVIDEVTEAIYEQFGR